MSDLHSFDPYHVFIATAHALRRRAERGALAMGATFGVAAEPLPFQLATVTHILSDQRIRHLIADEVGLGKTIEAGLVIAQRWVERRRKILLILPASLRKQWALELEEKFNLPAIEALHSWIQVVSPDGRLMARNFGDATFEIWDLTTRKRIA